jgi:hypothetical protein
VHAIALHTRCTYISSDAAPAPVPTFSNVYVAVEWAAAHARTGPDETLNYEDDDSEEERRHILQYIENIACEICSSHTVCPHRARIKL